jgi:eukaryotic-like serine/threonine-protein kinase
VDGPPDTLAGRYKLGSPIARGGMGTVWKARDEVLARTVAIKVLHEDLAQDRSFLDQFRVEALAAARLSHPNIVSIYDTGVEADGDGRARHFIVMEFCSGGNLADRLATRGPLEPGAVGVIGRAVCDALAFGHESGVVHRDVKPANILVTAEDNLKVADFGIAKAAFLTGDVTTTGLILGTVTYLSPEQLRGEDPDGRSDLYSLGATLYELLVGRPPFQADNELATAMMHLREQPPPPRSLKGAIPRALEDVVMTALAKDPAARYASATEMRDALQAAGGSSSSAVLPRLGPRGGLRRSARASPASGPRPVGFARSLAPVLLLIALAVVAALVVPSLVGSSDPPGSGQNRPPPSGRQAGALQVNGVSDLDPIDPEHPEEAPLAADGNESTAWTTSTYQTSMEALGKSGVGLVFDLGSQREVSGVKVAGCRGCSLEVRSSDRTSSTDESAFSVVDQVDDASDPQVFHFEPLTNRYWLIFITSLPGGDGGSASISEARFFGS